MVNPRSSLLTLISLLLVLTSLSPLAGCSGPGTSQNRGEDAFLQAAREKIDRDHIERVIGYLASEETGGRATGSPRMEEVRSFLVARMEEVGLEPAQILGLGDFRQTFPVPAKNCFLENASEEGVVEGVNLVGTIPGETDELLLITANYDGMGRDPVSGGIYPGADYNASGVAAALEIARFLCSLPNKPSWTVGIALLDGEECGGLGSSALAQLLEDRGLRDRCRVINLEGLGGGQGDYMDIWDQNYKKNRPTVEALLEAAGDLGVEVELGGADPGTSASVFFLYHIPAVSCDWSWFDRKEHQHFHRVTDTLENMNPENTRKVASVVALASCRMAWPTP